MIAGEPYRTDAWFETVDPYREDVVARVTDCTAEDASLAVEHALGALPRWSALPLDRRRAVLASTAESLDRRRAELVDLAVRDTGAIAAIAADTQVGAAIERLRRWAATPDTVLDLPQPENGAGLHSSVRRAPLGVVACISPYNFPLLAMVGKVAPALLAGNTVVMKPAPQDPLLTVALAEALRDGLGGVGAPPGAANLVTGARGELGAALTGHPDVGGVSFTGSTAVGIEIYRNAAPTMKRLLLELGGKGAALVRRDADPRRVVRAVLRTWTVHSGQVCLTPSRIIADPAVYDDVLAGLRAELSTLRIGDPRDPATTVGPVVSAAQRARVDALVATAEREGCRVERRDDLPAQGYFVAPTLVTGCDITSTVMREEAFGPVLCVVPAHGDDEMVAAANSTRYALTDYVFTEDPAAARALAPRLRAAQVGINTTRRNPNAPFGGNDASGIGRSGGLWALDSYTTVQTTTQDAPAGDGMS
ncbi:hypothetical protein BGM09_26705 [Streptomyces sp. CBMA29]|nr:aldehyde dehydrogenase family protein [Streptomyces sp. CBMA29]MBD0736708.1 hypothetical protein [Streptomyces sp. CBMA29]